jgi:hypothetical protein
MVTVPFIILAAVETSFIQILGTVAHGAGD